MLGMLSGFILTSILSYSVTISIWMNESQAAFGHRHHAQMGENPKLRVLFYRLAHLLEICAIPVFVFDGPL